MRKQIWILLALLLALGLVAAQCGGGTPAATQAPAAVATEAPAPTQAPVVAVEEFVCEDAIGCVDIAAGEPIHLAYMLATSGAVEFLGADSLGGIEIAIDERGQIAGHDLLLTGEDSLCSAEGGQTAATRVAADPTVVAVIGTNCSSAGTAASPIISEAGLTMLSPTNTDPRLTDPDATWKPGYFRTAHNDKFQGRVAAEFAYNELGSRSAATIHDGSPYAESLQQVFAEVFAELGGTVTFQGAVNVGDTDMRPILTSIAADPPDVLYYPIFQPEGDFITAQSTEVPGLEDTTLFGADGLLVKSFAPASGAAAEGMYLSGPYVSEEVAAYAAFLDTYEANTGGPPPAGFAAHAYDGTNIILDAIQAVAVVDAEGDLHIGRQALRDAVAATANFDGLTGLLTCDEFGDCATGEALAIYELTAAQVASEDNWPPPVVWTPTTGAVVAGEVMEPKLFGMVTDVGGIDDKGFNQIGWEGMLRAQDELGVEVSFLESQEQTDYERNIGEYLRQDAAGIVTVGFLLGDATREASEANPNVPFAIVDFPSQTSGDLGLLFAVDQPSFVAGYLAAGMTETGIVCTFGGIKIPPVVQFMVAYEKGVEYYNAQKGADVTVLGWKTDPAAEGGGDGSFTGNFESTDDGRRFAENFFDEGCDIIFPVAGPVGIGSAAATKDRGFTMIGVDTDYFERFPETEEIYLTSVLKNIDVAVFEAVKSMADGTFQGGNNFIGTLDNGGVGIAPYHGFEDSVPADLKAEVEALTQAIAGGEIPTGWPVEAPAAAGEVSLVMSFVPSGDTEEILASGDQIAAMVSERTGYNVTANVATSYAAVIEAMGAGNAQIGWLNTFGYVLAHEKYGADVALATVRFGTTFYQGQIITQADSGITSIADLAGKTFCRPDPLSTSGWIIPSITMAAAGLDIETDIEVVDVGSHNNVVTAVYNGECDAGASFVDARSSVEDDLPDVKEKVVVIQESPDIPNDTVSFAADVPADVRANVVNALLDIAATEEGQAALEQVYEIAGLQPTDDSFYDGFRADLDAAGINIEDLAQ